jgi:hypothetical protein
MNGQCLAPVLRINQLCECSDAGGEIETGGHAQKKEGCPHAPQVSTEGHQHKGDADGGNGDHDGPSVGISGGKKSGAHHRDQVARGHQEEEGSCLPMGKGEILLNGREKRSKDDPGNEVLEKDRREKQYGCQIGTKADRILFHRKPFLKPITSRTVPAKRHTGSKIDEPSIFSKRPRAIQSGDSRMPH